MITMVLTATAVLALRLALPARVHHLHGEMISCLPCWAAMLFSST